MSHLSNSNKARKLGFFIASIRSKLYWSSSRLRNYGWNKLLKDIDSSKISFPKRLKYYIQEFIRTSQIYLIKCERCDAIGIDYQSEKHGWEYQGHHIWLCSKCKFRVDKTKEIIKERVIDDSKSKSSS